ncbi:MAG: ferredoxin [Modestobacter sp.]|jgi:ferredoxin|nr:ferredoxin [Modestobacter sp.]
MTARVAVDTAVCELHGQCVEAAPEVFAFDGGGQLQYRETVPDDEVTAVQDAQFLCPTQAIALSRDA